MAMVPATGPRLLRLDQPSLVSRRQISSGCSATLRDIRARHLRLGDPCRRSFGRKSLEGPAAEGLNPPSARPISARGRFINATLIIPDQLMTIVWPMLNAGAHRAIAC
jgi:hypothetical protein